MERFRKTLSIRKKKKTEPNETIKPQLWIEDEKRIKDGSCSFQVKYLGCIEVFESRGMQVCEEAIKALRKSKKKSQRAILFVSGDALRVSDEISKHLIVDQTIEKVSFCAPDRVHDKGFAYICRDGATRRWMCHAFLAIKESGERLSHAVGCAFAICLEKKQKRERDAVQLTSTNEDSTFVRMNTFRQTSLTERLLDPQSAIIVTQPNIETKLSTPSDMSLAIQPLNNSVSQTSNDMCKSGALPRPRASSSLFERQTSLRMFPKLQETSLFKQNLSLRLNETPSTLLQLNRLVNGDSIPEENLNQLDQSLETISINTEPNFKLSHQSLSSNPIAPSICRETPITQHPILPKLSQLELTFGDNLLELNDDESTILKNFTDPFSAAPFNPETIQQHHNQQQLLSDKTNIQSRISVKCENDFLLPSEWPESVQTSDTKSFPVTNNQAWPLTIPKMSAASVSNAVPRTISPFTSKPVASYGMTLFGASPLSSNSITKESAFSENEWTRTPNWMLAPSPVMPPEPDRFADPFDVDWADRVTAMATGKLAVTSNTTTPHNFMSDLYPAPLGRTVSNNPKNPFLNQPPNSAQLINGNR